jgi:hypothetical protein
VKVRSRLGCWTFDGVPATQLRSPQFSANRRERPLSITKAHKVDASTYEIVVGEVRAGATPASFSPPSKPTKMSRVCRIAPTCSHHGRHDRSYGTSSLRRSRLTIEPRFVACSRSCPSVDLRWPTAFERRSAPFASLLGRADYHLHRSRALACGMLSKVTSQCGALRALAQVGHISSMDRPFASCEPSWRRS